jgi:hypothetical protein
MRLPREVVLGAHVPHEALGEGVAVLVGGRVRRDARHADGQVVHHLRFVCFVWLVAWDC